MMALKHTERTWACYMRRAAAEVGIPDSYRHIIMFLSRHPGSSQKELAEFSRTTYAAVSQTVKEMQLTGYIIKEEDPQDRRYARLSLTEKGQDAAQRVLEKLRFADGIITDAIGEKKEQELIELMDKISQIIKEQL